MPQDRSLQETTPSPGFAARPRGVVLASPGGLGGGGGMGTVTRAMKAWVDDNAPEVRIKVVDPRGEGRVFWSLLYGPLALITLLHCRIWKGFDLLHLQVSERLSFVRKGVLLAAARTLGMRVVLHHHGAELIPFFRDASPRMKRLVQWAVNRADMNIVLGDGWRQFLVDEVGAPPEKVVVAVNATKDLPPGTSPSDRDPWNFLVLANLSPRKGIGELLEATAQLRAAGAPARLTLAGGGEVERYRLQASQLGIASACTFTGWIRGDEVTQLLFTHAALVLPSHAEGLPMTLIEAASARLPVITTPVGSIPDHFEHDVTCLLVTPGNVTELVSALRRLATDPALCRRLSENGRLLYEERFGLQGYMQRMLALYARVSERLPAPR
ncbi:MAG: glycosyltransferase family 1 protein [Comamonadaceae bacterium]|nr:MAG: glycosyltransferase family 1 protein [Comamonadaceae bacterium]